MARATINIYEVVSDIQAKKEAYRIRPSYATFRQIKAEFEHLDDGTLYEMLEAEVEKNMLVRHRHINGYAYSICEE